MLMFHIGDSKKKFWYVQCRSFLKQKNLNLEKIEFPFEKYIMWILIFIK